MAKYDQGDNFVKERTGSATMINVDGKWEHDFTDDQATITGKKKKIIKTDKNNRETK